MTCKFKKRVGDLLCTALEGGSNYWYSIVLANKPTEITLQEFPDQLYYHEYPLNKDGYLIIQDQLGGTTHRLEQADLADGLRFMKQDYPKHYQDWVDENEDAETGDVFLQCCLFGDVIYG